MAANLVTNQSILNWWDLKRLRAWVKPVFQFLMSIAFVASFFSMLRLWFTPKTRLIEKQKPVPVMLLEPTRKLTHEEIKELLLIKIQLIILVREQMQVLLALQLLGQIQAKFNHAPANNNSRMVAPEFSPPPPYNPNGSFKAMEQYSNPEHIELPNPVIPEFEPQKPYADEPPAYENNTVENTETLKPMLNSYYTQIKIQQFKPSAPPIELEQNNYSSISCGA